MAITTYALLQSQVASLLHRDDLTTQIQESIALCESEMQTKCKLVEFESTATVTITSGSGTLPTGFVGMRSIYWEGDEDYPLVYVTPAQYDAYRSLGTSDPWVYTISGSTIRTAPMNSGSAVMTYSARFTALSDSNTSNSLLTDFPDAYLYGTLKHVCVFTQDSQSMQTYGVLFNAACDRIDTNNQARTFAGPLTVRAR